MSGWLWVSVIRVGLCTCERVATRDAEARVCTRTGELRLQSIALARALQIFAQNSFGVFVFGFKKYGISFEHVPTVGEPTNVFHIFPIFYGQVYFQSIIRRVDFPLRIFIGSMNLN